MISGRQSLKMPSNRLLLIPFFVNFHCSLFELRVLFCTLLLNFLFRATLSQHILFSALPLPSPQIKPDIAISHFLFSFPFATISLFRVITSSPFSFALSFNSFLDYFPISHLRSYVSTSPHSISHQFFSHYSHLGSYYKMVLIYKSAQNDFESGNTFLVIYLRSNCLILMST